MRTRIILTLKQHRFETVAITVLCLGVGIAALVEAWRLNSLNFPTSCLMGGRVPYYFNAAPTACVLASQRFNDMANGTDMSFVRMFEQILPFIAGIVMGVPIVASEIETGTAPLSWALAGSRVRWLLGKMLAVILLLVPLLVFVGLAADALQGAMAPGLDPHASFDYYAARGVFMVFWGLAAFLGTVALSTIFGRTMPAIMVALFLCVFARGLWELSWSHTLLRQFAVLGDQNTYGTPDLWVYQTDELYLNGQVWTGDINLWYEQHAFFGPTPDASGVVPNFVEPVDPGPPPEPKTYVIHGDQYWLVAAVQNAVLLAGSLFCAAIALMWVGRRKPY
ncbi:MAG: ABC transporter permease subunit [Candidatus Limnocylindrales bacterium]